MIRTEVASSWDYLADLGKALEKFFPFKVVGKNIEIDGKSYLVQGATVNTIDWTYDITVIDMETGEKVWAKFEDGKATQVKSIS